MVEGVKDGNTAVAWELDNNNTMFALLTDNVEAEGLEPTTIEEAKMQLDWPKWEEAINAELKSLDDTHAWNVVKCPKNTNVVSCKWVFKIKKNTVDEIDKYKACLVAHGFIQQYGVGCHGTYTPIARLASLCLVLAIAAHHGWDINIFNFHSAFLNGKLYDNGVIFMELLPGFNKQDHDLVACLCIALYSSKQGALKWYQHLYGILYDLGFTQMKVDWGVFVAIITDHILILALHMNNYTVTGSSLQIIKAFKDEIGKHFQMTNLGPISWLFGMKVTRDWKNHTISLSQKPYINAILAKYKFTDVKLVSIPLNPHLQLSDKQSPRTTSEIMRMCNIPYHQAIGSLIHLAAGTCPNIAFAMSFVAQFNNIPGWDHWEAVKCIYKYLAGTTKLALTFGTQMNGLIGYVNVDGAIQEHRHVLCFWCKS